MKPPVYKVRLCRGEWRVFQGWKTVGDGFDTEADAQTWIDGIIAKAAPLPSPPPQGGGQEKQGLSSAQEAATASGESLTGGKGNGS